MERSLSWYEAIDVVGIQREERTTVLRYASGFAGNHSASEVEVDRLNERHDQAVVVDDRKVARVAAGILGVD